MEIGYQMTKAQKAERENAIAELREFIKPGDTVYTILDHVSASGMRRAIRVVVPRARPSESSIHLPKDWKTEIDFLYPNWLVGKAIGAKHWKRNGREQDALVIGGCGMDMGFALVYELSHVLYGREGYQCMGAGKCPSNYHVNHRDTLRCEGTIVYNPDGPNTGERCQLVHGATGRKYYGIGAKRCPTCKGKGAIPNPEGLERFDLVHTDGYALRHRWL